MLGKITYLGILVLISNAVLFMGAAFGGIFLTTSVPVVGAAITVTVKSRPGGHRVQAAISPW